MNIFTYNLLSYVKDLKSNKLLKVHYLLLLHDSLNIMMYLPINIGLEPKFCEFWLKINFKKSSNVFNNFGIEWKKKLETTSSLLTFLNDYLKQKILF